LLGANREGTPLSPHGDVGDVLAQALHTQLLSFQQRPLCNRIPTPQDLMELSHRIYKASRSLYNEADSQGMRVFRDELMEGER